MAQQYYDQQQAGTRYAFNPLTNTLFGFEGKLQRAYELAPPRARMRWQNARDWCAVDTPDPFDFRDALGRVEAYTGPGRGAERPDTSTQALADFLSLIPQEVKTELGVYRSRSWQMLQFLHDSPAAVELSQTNKALALALTAMPEFTGQSADPSLSRAKTWVTRRRRDIVRMLGFEERRAVVRILSRVVAETLDIKPLLWLRHALRVRETRDRLCHLQRINHGVVALLINHHLLPAVSSHLLHDVSVEPAFDSNSHRIDRLLDDTVEMLTCTGRYDVVFNSLRKLREVHDDLAWTLRKEAPAVDEQLAECPVAGLDGVIEPLLTSHEIWREGVAQRNCVGSPHYLKRVKAGRRFLYRVLSPQRCTLAIAPSGRGWTILELECAGNRAAEKATWRWVRGWLKEANLSASAERPGRVEGRSQGSKRVDTALQMELSFQ